MEALERHVLGPRPDVDAGAHAAGERDEREVLGADERRLEPADDAVHEALGRAHAVGAHLEAVQAAAIELDRRDLDAAVAGDVLDADDLDVARPGLVDGERHAASPA